MAKKPVKKVKLTDTPADTEIVLDAVPEQKLTDADLPKQVNVEHKTSGKRFVVNRKHYLENSGDLKLV